jgi:hypothetical protein
MLEKLANGVRSIDLKTICLAAELLQKAKIMEGGTDEKQFHVEGFSCPTALFIGPEEDSMRVVEEKRSTELTKKPGGFSRQLTVGNSALNLLILSSWGWYRDDHLWLAKGSRRLGTSLRETYVGGTSSGYDGRVLERKTACE